MLEKKNENEMSIPNLYYLRNFEIASPEPGDVIRVKRFCCNKSKRNHYGIYVGNNEVVYFDDTVKDRTKRLVKKASLASFTTSCLTFRVFLSRSTSANSSESHSPRPLSLFTLYFSF